MIYHTPEQKEEHQHKATEAICELGRFLEQHGDRSAKALVSIADSLKRLADKFAPRTR